MGLLAFGGTLVIFIFYVFSPITLLQVLSMAGPLANRYEECS